MISLSLLNILILIILACTVLFWRYIYPRKTLSPLLLLFVFAFIPLIGVWRTGSYQSGDFNDHIYFSMSFFQSLMDGIWFPRWSGGFCGGYGYPHIQYFYHLPYYLEAAFHYFLRLSFVNSQKLLICVSYLFAAVSSYFWLKQEWGKQPAFVGSLLYILAPYILAGAHFRITIGEGIGTALLPFLLWCIYKLFHAKLHRVRWYWLWFICGLIAMILAHHVAPILSIPFLFSYFCLQSLLSERKLRFGLIAFLLSIILSFFITSYHWVPIMLESGFIGQAHLRQIEFPPVSMYFFSPWRFGLLNQGHHGELSWTLGYAQWIVVIAAIVLLLGRKCEFSDRVKNVFYLSWFGLLFFFLLPITEPIWLAIPVVNNFQFSHRLFFLLALVGAALGALVWKNQQYLLPTFLKKLPRIFLLTSFMGFLILTTILNWGQRTLIADLDDEKLLLQLPSWCDRVAIPSWLPEKQFKSLPKREGNFVVVSGVGDVQTVLYKMEEHRYKIQAQSDVLFRENTTNFPGWTAYIDGKQTTIVMNTPNYPGIMAITVPSGNHELTFIYEKTPVQKLFEKVSVVSLILLTSVAMIFLFRPNDEK